MLIRRRDFLSVTSAFGGVLMNSPGEGKAQTLSKDDPNRPLFRSESAQVLIPFTAVDKQDHLVGGLSAEDVRLLADGKEQHINFLSLEDRPASILFVIDISGSMKKPVANVQEAMRRMLRAAAPDDEFAVIEFNDTPRVTVGFTSITSRVEERVKEIGPVGRTSLTDAIVLAFQELKRSHQERKAVIVLSDGQDNHSRYVRKDVIRLGVETDARLYAIELCPPIGEGFVPATFLEALAHTTGGRYLPVVDRKSIPDIVNRIDVHRSYVLGFTPPLDQRDGKTHQIQLKLKTTASAGPVRLFWKHRYLAPVSL
ncbi:MAG TPA: VWA domain-containing protein [Bryobacteraceae bacterium]|nr:VWA domain-containing protein [Bryobacteraceae bacterium]